MLPFSLVLKLNFYNSKILSSLLASFGSVLYFFVVSGLAFVPLCEELKPIDKILLSFKIAKKNYYKTLMITLKSYLLSIFVFTIPFVIIYYINNLKVLYENNYD